MARATTKQLNDRLDQAERSGRFFVAGSEACKKALLRRMRNGEMDLLEIVPSVFVRRRHYEALTPLVRERQLARALSVKHPSWVFCGITAAVLHGLYVSYSDVLGGARLIVEVEGRRRSLVYELAEIRFRQLTRCVVSTVAIRGVRAISALDAAISCARRLSFPRALAVMDSLMRLYDVRKETLMQHIDALGRYAHGVRCARRAVRWANGLSENGGESLARAVMLEEGFREPMLQVPVFDEIDGSWYRVDFCWRLEDGVLIFGEFDGGEKLESECMRRGRSVAEVACAERLRESRLTLQSARVVRFTLQTVANRAAFSRLLDAYGVPRSRDFFTAAGAA